VPPSDSLNAASPQAAAEQGRYASGRTMVRLILLSMLLLASCAEDIDSRNFDIDALEIEAQFFFASESERGNEKFPEYIPTINPRRIWVEDEGLYIQLSQSGKTESGIFVSRDKNEEPKNTSYNPTFKKIESAVYNYVILE
jgi:hypothetical protein